MDFNEWSGSLQAVGMTLFVFGLLVWFYVVAIQITHPQWLSGPLTHIDIPPFNWRLDEIGILGFATSAFGFLVWRLENKD